MTSRDRLTKARILRLQASALQLWKDFCNFEISRGSGDAADTTCDILLTLLIRISEFDVASLQIVLRSSTVDPSIKDSLPVAINKIGRYYNITCDLIDASRSRHCILFSRISIHAIDKPHVDTSFIANHSAGFEETFRRVTCSSQQFCHSNFDPNSVSAAKAEFQRLLAGSGAEWKVHAEIQIILFYEQNPSLRPPRIIGSSKSACYLCNLFVHHHESFQVARSHGRLYDRWILPKEVFDQDSSMRPVVDKLNASIESEILDVLKTKRKPFPHPAESAVNLGPPWSPNPTLSIIHSQESLRKTTEYLSSNPSEDLVGRGSDASSSCSPSISRASTERVYSIQNNIADAIQTDLHTHVASSTPNITYRHLFQGESTYCQLTHRDDVLIVQMDIGKVYASSDHLPGDTTSNSPHIGCWVQVSWRASSNPILETNRCFEGIDIRALACDRDQVFEEGAALSSKELVLQMKGHLVLVKYSLEEPQ